MLLRGQAGRGHEVKPYAWLQKWMLMQGHAGGGLEVAILHACSRSCRHPDKLPIQRPAAGEPAAWLKVLPFVVKVSYQPCMPRYGFGMPCRCDILSWPSSSSYALSQLISNAACVLQLVAEVNLEASLPELLVSTGAIRAVALLSLTDGDSTAYMGLLRSALEVGSQWRDWPGLVGSGMLRPLCTACCCLAICLGPWDLDFSCRTLMSMRSCGPV